MAAAVFVSSESVDHFLVPGASMVKLCRYASGPAFCSPEAFLALTMPRSTVPTMKPRLQTLEARQERRVGSVLRCHRLGTKAVVRSPVHPWRLLRKGIGNIGMSAQLAADALSLPEASVARRLPL